MKISLITVSFNSGATIRDTIESVLAQSYPEVEYLVVDGASKDNTVSIIREYEERFGGRLRWVSESDRGLYDAMNKGIRMATGDVVGILNSDDFFSSADVLERVAQTFADESLDAVYGDIHFVGADDLKKCVRYYSSRMFEGKWMRLGFMPAHPSFYMRRECFERFGMYKTDYKIAADFEFLLRSIFIGKARTRYIPMDMVTMRTGGASTAGLNSHKIIMREHLRAFRENGVYTNRFLLSLRYLYKIGELVWHKMKA